MYLTYCRSVEVDWSSIDGTYRWFPYCFADGRVKDLLEVVLQSRKRDASEAFGANRQHADWAVVCGAYY